MHLVRFLEKVTTWQFCFEIYCPLEILLWWFLVPETRNPKTSLVISTWLICIRMLVVRQHGFDFKTPFSKEVGRLVVQKGPDSVVKVIIEKSRGGRFLWNKNWDLGWSWSWGGWHCWNKNIWADYLRPFFSSFHGLKFFSKIKNIVVSAGKVSCPQSKYPVLH